MDGLITIILTCTCILCFVFQGLFGKLYSASYEGETADATAVFSTLYGGFVGVSVLAVALGFRLNASPATWMLGVLNGAVLADHCLVGAGAVVTSKTNAPAGSLLLGSPAKIVGTITKEQWDALEEDAEKYLKNAQKWL